MSGKRTVPETSQNATRLTASALIGSHAFGTFGLCRDTGGILLGGAFRGTCMQVAGQNAQGPGGSDCSFAFTEPDKGGSPVNVIINPDVAESHLV
ncbi:hypothetical protein Pure05_36080 [Paenarthrobacter ureafaciens]|nr:hypothetical protein Pure01_36140 [Paenarthrobacter ureafaciens]GLU65370.1 hypothetical protein Pure02_36200 [Paenarthrobacter ureafaciens]GLU69757.1 hypothetical protein Pure03_37330 [Paenarthrobacter ureafaciens]GLU73926.1 hypothetical protein Pure04_36410 [Paenarthrobacter ureafaciens]GLU78168.1 hypothetical protein Pure05_36080 [Paenarthrobacter ureafaciens]